MNDANLDTQRRNFFKASVAAASGVPSAAPLCWGKPTRKLWHAPGN